ncbi:MAG: sugar phosphate nucleotidyltransferase [Hellea sp.]
MSKLGVILAAGKGTRLYPLTLSVNKHLLNIYNKPMIYYPITNLIMLNCTRIVIITNEKDVVSFKPIIETLKKLNIDCAIKVQSESFGIPTAVRDAISDEIFEELYVILGDNIFFGNGFIESLQRLQKSNLILTKIVKDPSQFGVISEQKNRRQMVEKPKEFVSNQAVTGFYRFGADIIDVLEECRPSSRGETEIADVINLLLNNPAKDLDIVKLTRATLWLDAGTFEDLANTNALVAQISQRQGQDFGSIEEAALQNGYISVPTFKKIIRNYPPNSYSQYLESIVS